MDGVECIDALRTALVSRIPAVVITGDMRSQSLEEITKHNIGVVTKPIDGDELLQLISRVYLHFSIDSPGEGTPSSHAIEKGKYADLVPYKIFHAKRDPWGHLGDRG